MESIQRMTIERLSGPLNKNVVVPSRLRYPDLRSSTDLLFRDQVDAINLASAPPNTIDGLEQFCAAIEARPAIETDYPHLFDRLGGFIARAKAPSETFGKCRDEYAMHTAIAPLSINIAGSFDEFAEALSIIHRLYGVSATGFRKIEIKLMPDDRGNSISYPSHYLVEPLLRSLHAFLATYAEEYPTFCAAAAYVGIIHAHPFLDGNGRTARTFYNLILRDYAKTGHFMALRQIAAVSKGGFLIRLRRTLYMGDWKATQEFFSDAIRLSVDVQKDIAQ